MCTLALSLSLSLSLSVSIYIYIYIYIHTHLRHICTYIYICIYILMTCWLVCFVKALHDGGVAAEAGFSVCVFTGCGWLLGV